MLLGPSGTGKSVFLKSLIGLLKPDKGSIVIRDVDIARCSEAKLYETRKLFGVLFQDGALFGSMNLFDNIAFPLREHTKKSEREIRDIVLEKMDMVGLAGAEGKLPGEISGGMRKRAGLARALVLNPEIILFDEPDSGLDPVRVAYLNQLIIDLNAQTDATFLIVTHDIGTARTVPDNLGMLFKRELVMFGPREVLLTSEEPVVKQFLNGRREGPIGMSEEKDASQVAAELASIDQNAPRRPGTGPKGSVGGGVPPQIQPSPGAARPPGRQTPPGPGAGDAAHPAAARAEGHHRTDGPGRPRRSRSQTSQPEGPRTVRARLMPSLSPVGGLKQAGSLFALFLDVGRLTFKRPWQGREFIQQAWFVASVTIIPTMLVTIPFGAVIALELGTLARQIGAQSFTGSASVLAILREASPIVVALLIAGAGGSAICADLGSRKIRDEIDAMEVLGISPVQRLVVPRVLACVLVAVALNGLVSVVGVAGGYFFNVILQGGTPGAYLASFSALAQLPDLYTGEIKAFVFGILAGVVASYKGLNAGGGPKGVGDAVNQSVIITFMLLFAVNFVITAVYFQVVPAKGS